MQRIYIPYILRWVYTHSCMHNTMLIFWKHVRILVWMCFCLAVGMELVLLVLDEVCAIPWGRAVLKAHSFIQGHPSGIQKRKIISLTPGWNPSVHETCVFCMFGGTPCIPPASKDWGDNASGNSTEILHSCSEHVSLCIHMWTGCHSSTPYKRIR